MASKRLGKLRSLIEDFAGTALPDLGDPLQQRAESRSAVAIVGRIVSTAVKRFKIRRQKNAHRPTSRAGGSLDESHIDSVHIRALFPINFHADIVAVQDFRD